MLRVYLDQMAWINLVKAAQGRPLKPEHGAFLAIARYGVVNGFVEFPLSSIHYEETLQRGDPKSRGETAKLMAELSRMRTIAGAPEIQDEEIDRALQSRFGRPINIRLHPDFGYGAGHAFNRPALHFNLPADFRVTNKERVRLEAEGTEALEFGALSGNSGALGAGGVSGATRGRVIVAKHAEEEQQIGETIRRNFHGSKRLREAWIARGIGEAIPDIVRGLNHAGISPIEFAALSVEEVDAFFFDIPVLSTYWELRFLKHQNPSSPWSGNDMRDIAFLCVAVVHCDAVVTERHWKHILNRTDRPQLYNTVVENDVGNIIQLLLRGQP